jgi:hypothetical protein
LSFFVPHITKITNFVKWGTFNITPFLHF